MNRLQRLIEEIRAGRVFSAANESKLRDAVQSLTDLLAQLGVEENSRAGGVSLEQRTFAIEGVEIRAIEGKQVISGHAAVFNQLSVPLWGFRERIRPGAFLNTLRSGADVFALWQHDTARVLGRTKNNTLRLHEDDRGLAIEFDPPDTQDGRDALVSISRGDVDKMSFGFNVPDKGDSWASDPDSDLLIRDLIDIDLKEVSPVTFPAYPATDVSMIVRSAPEWVQRALSSNGVDDKAVAEQQARARFEFLSRQLDLTGL